MPKFSTVFKKRKGKTSFARFHFISKDLSWNFVKSWFNFQLTVKWLLSNRIVQQSLDLFDTRFVRIRFIRLHFLLPKIRFVRMSLDLFEFSKKNSRFFGKMLQQIEGKLNNFEERIGICKNTWLYCFLKSS